MKPWIVDNLNFWLVDVRSWITGVETTRSAKSQARRDKHGLDGTCENRVFTGRPARTAGFLSGEFCRVPPRVTSQMVFWASRTNLHVCDTTG